jgi:3-isopropylmalate/(R)-2-methylmalate dehydratase small subunit
MSPATDDCPTPRHVARIHKYGDHIDTDVILPGRYLSIQDPRELARHCLEGVDPKLPQRDLVDASPR